MLVDRKSTRLNSSHRTISYAVFCLSTSLLYLHSFPTRRSSDLDFVFAILESEIPVSFWIHVQEWGRHQTDDDQSRKQNAGYPRIVVHQHFLETQEVPGSLGNAGRSEEHTSELQSPYDLVCRLLLVHLPPLSTLFPYTTLFRS